MSADRIRFTQALVMTSASMQAVRTSTGDYATQQSFARRTK
jgi:hypothetical protein